MGNNRRTLLKPGWGMCACFASSLLALAATQVRADSPGDSADLVPLTELKSGTYRGEMGGLYGGGRNEPSEAQQATARRAAAQIEPVDRWGFPNPGGKIVLLSIGMSNTTQEFSRFKQLADADEKKSKRLVIVDGAQGGQAAQQWSRPDAPPWGRAEDRLYMEGVTPAQVQVLWIKQAEISPARLGEFPSHARTLADNIIRILNIAYERFPNLRLAYLSSRIYAGYATTQLNPEPYAYESAFAVRWVIEAQEKGSDPRLYDDSSRGTARAPVVLWGPYLWASGNHPRAIDGLTWQRDDLGRDGTHPSDAGRQKVATQLLRFFESDSTARGWFCK